MTPYFFVYALLWLLALLRSLSRKEECRGIFLTQILLLAGFSAFRFETGYDWPVYGSHYVGEGVGASLIFEPGYELLVRGFVALGVPFKYYVSIISVSMVAGIAYIIHRLMPAYKETAIALMFALPDFFLIPVFSVIRQTISLIFFLVAVIRFRDGRKKTATILALVAFSFHYSTIIICAIVALFFWLDFSPRQYAKLFCVGLLAYLTAIDPLRMVLKAAVESVVPGYSDYLLRDTFNASVAYRILSACVFIFVWALIVQSKLLIDKLDGRRTVLFGHVALLSLILPILLFNFPTFTSRFMFFGSFFIVGYSLYSAHNRMGLNRALVVLGLGVVMLVPLYRFLGSPFSSPYVPYQSMFYFDENNSTGTERTQELLDMLDSLW